MKTYFYNDDNTVSARKEVVCSRIDSINSTLETIRENKFFEEEIAKNGFLIKIILFNSK